MIQNLYLFLVFFVPLLFTSDTSEFFELPKMYLVYAVTLVIAATHLLNVIRGRAPIFRRTPLTWPLLIFLAAMGVSTFFSVDVHTSIFGYYSRLNGGLLSLAVFALLYFILTVYIDDRFKDRFVFVSLLSGAAVALIGILEHFDITQSPAIAKLLLPLGPLYTILHPGSWTQDLKARVFSTLGQPNWLAAYLCILLPFSLDRFLRSKHPILKSCFLLLTSLFYVCLLFTKSKSGIIAAVLSLALYGLIYIRQNFKANWRQLLIPAVLVLLASFTITNPIKDVVFFTSAKPSGEAGATTLVITPSEDIRKIVWQGAFTLWHQFPLIGTGPETFAYTYYWVRPAAHNLTSEWNFLYNKAHNEYLNYLATTGSLGFLAYLGVIIFMVYQLIKTRSAYRWPALAALVSVLITNISGFSVVLISLYFFLLPSLVLPAAKFKPPTPRSNLYLIVLIPAFLYLSSKLLFYYLADITYARALNADAGQQYSAAFDSIRQSVYFRNDEPVTLSKLADISAKMALLNIRSKNSEAVDADTAIAIRAMDKAKAISPFNLNLWKERAQTYYYLSAVDSKYYLSAIDALDKATRLAPTDAMSFYLLGKFYQTINQNDDAIKNFQTALKLKSNYDYAAFALGKTYFDEKKYDLARPMFETTLKIAPDNTDAKNYLAVIATASAAKP